MIFSSKQKSKMARIREIFVLCVLVSVVVCDDAQNSEEDDLDSCEKFCKSTYPVHTYPEVFFYLTFLWLRNQLWPYVLYCTRVDTKINGHEDKRSSEFGLSQWIK